MAEINDPSQERPSLPRVIDEQVESQRLEAIAREHPEPQALAEAIAEEDLISAIDVDGTAELREFPLEAVRRLEQLDPFGAGNPYPRFILAGVRVIRPEKMGRNGEHLRLNLSADGTDIIVGVKVEQFHELVHCWRDH